MDFKNHDATWKLVETIVKKRDIESVERYGYLDHLWGALAEADVVMLRAPSGCGKTEAALAPFFLQALSEEWRWSSAIYVLPTRSLVTNMYRRICKACDSLSDPRGPKLSLIISYDYGGFLRTKPFLEGDLVVTTYDAMLYTFYGFRSLRNHVLLQLGRMTTSLIIADESQLLQDVNWYSLSLLPYHIANLARSGATVLLMGATIPRLLEDGIKEALGNTERLELKSVTSEDRPKRGNVKLEPFRNGSLIDELDVTRSYEKPMLLVFNTVERAVQAYERLVDAGHNVMLLHSRLKLLTRRQRESVFEEGGQLDVVVSTQVIEAGLDYNFRTVLIEVAPVDALIQRAGRCARRPGIDGTVIVYTNTELARGVYPDRVIERTLKVISEEDLKEAIYSAKDATKLVDNVFGEDFINELKMNAQSELDEALGYVKLFDKKMFIPRGLESAAEKLLRLGVELKAVLLDREDYRAVLGRVEEFIDRSKQMEWESCSVDIEKYLLRESTINIGFDGKRHVKVPALKHKVSDREVYVVLRVNDEQVRTKVKAVNSIAHVARDELAPVYFLLNPEYFKVRESYELGVVKPYGLSS